MFVTISKRQKQRKWKLNLFETWEEQKWINYGKKISNDIYMEDQLLR